MEYSISKTLQEYMRKKGLTSRSLAEELGVPLRSLQAWLSGQRTPKKPCHREALEKKFPGIFSGRQFVSSSEEPIAPEEPKPKADKAEVLTNISLARIYIAALEKIFRWFLFEVSAKERNQFREKLGEEWNRFFNFCRAMLGEKAFAVVKEETELVKK
jgi:transcriptional regulator with XRE-family HTH domain